MNTPENLTPRDLVNKHIHDENHVVTEEEMQKLKVGDSAQSEEKINKEAEIRKEEIEQNRGNDALPNPYSVL